MIIRESLKEIGQVKNKLLAADKKIILRKNPQKVKKMASITSFFVHSPPNDQNILKHTFVKKRSRDLLRKTKITFSSSKKKFNQQVFMARKRRTLIKIRY